MPPLPRQRFAAWAAVAALAAGLLLFWIEANLGGDTATLAVTDLANLAAALGAAFACARRAGQEAGRTARGWNALAIACLLWALGVAYVTVFDLWVERGVPFAEREIPFPSLADVGYLGFVPFALAGVALLPRGIFRHEVRTRNALDGVLVALAFVAVAWRMLLRDMAARGLGDVETLLGLAYPVSDIALMVTAACALAFVPREDRGNLLLVVLGLGFLALADFGFFFLVAHDVVGISAINILWPAGFACLGLGAARPPEAWEAGPAREPVRDGLVTLASIAGLLVVAFDVLDGLVDPFMAMLGILLVGAVLARLGLPVLERRRLQTVVAPSDDL